MAVLLLTSEADGQFEHVGREREHQYKHGARPGFADATASTNCDSTRCPRYDSGTNDNDQVFIVRSKAGLKGRGCDELDTSQEQVL